MTARPNLRIVEPPADTLARLLAEREAVKLKAARIEEDLASLCRQWSDDNGYRVRLTPEQVKRAMK